MFGKKKNNESSNSKPTGKRADMFDFGLMGNVEEMEAMIYGDFENDADLEAELLALQGEEPPVKQHKKKTNLADLEKNIAECLSDELPECDDVTEEALESELDNLMSASDEPPVIGSSSELKSSQNKPFYTDDQKQYNLQTDSSNAISQSSISQTVNNDVFTILSDRLNDYQIAMDNAKKAGDSSKAKRMARGITTLNDMIKKVKTGRVINSEEIPPPVVTKSKKQDKDYSSSVSESSHVDSSTKWADGQQPTYNIPTDTKEVKEQRSIYDLPPNVNLSDDDKKTYQMLVERRDQYKQAALECKKSNDQQTTITYLKISKQFDHVIEALCSAKPIDLSKMPPPPVGYTSKMKVNSNTEQKLSSSSHIKNDEANLTEEPLPLTEDDNIKLFNAPTKANSMEEALTQRLAKYKSAMDEAKGAGNSSKARRMGRIVKQYEDSIKNFKAGKPVDFEELPCPPGFPPFPQSKAAPESNPSTSIKTIEPAKVEQAQPSTSSKQPPSVSPQASAQTKAPSVNRQMSATSRSAQQTLFLEERQLQYKKAAFQAKKNDDIELAKKYIRISKGFDQMIEASKSGLPVDMSQVPPLPGATSGEFDEASFEFVNTADVDNTDRDAQFKRLEQELINQIRTCSTNSEHFTRLGDITSTAKFDKMSQNARKDLDSLKNAYKHGDPVPKFHYEMRTFSLVQSCTDLGDNDLELIIVRGINYNLPSGFSPSDLDTYVKYEFPFPSEKPQSSYTNTVKHTNNPEYDQGFKLEVNRKSRVFLRLLKNKAIKLEIYYRRGFLKGDKVLGTVNVKLQPLENICVLHDSYDLMDGRKSAGGKLEVKIRVRNPFCSKQVEEVKEKWLVIDKFQQSLQPEKSTSQAKVISQSNFPKSYTSNEVLQLEKLLLDKEITKLKSVGNISAAEEATLKNKSKLIESKIAEQKSRIQAGGVSELRAYASCINNSKTTYLQEAQALVKQGNRQKAQILVQKKDIVEKEIQIINEKLKKL